MKERFQNGKTFHPRLWALLVTQVGHSLAPLTKGVKQMSPREALEKEARIARMYVPGSSCLITNGNGNDGTDGGDGAVNWSRAGALLQILAWIFILRQVT